MKYQQSKTMALVPLSGPTTPKGKKRCCNNQPQDWSVKTSWSRQTLVFYKAAAQSWEGLIFFHTAKTSWEKLWYPKVPSLSTSHTTRSCCNNVVTFLISPSNCVWPALWCDTGAHFCTSFIVSEVLLIQEDQKDRLWVWCCHLIAGGPGGPPDQWFLMDLRRNTN